MKTTVIGLTKKWFTFSLELQETRRIPVLCTKKKCYRKYKKKPSKTKQRNPCHKLQPTMNRIPTGNVWMDLLSKVSMKVKTSLTQTKLWISGQTQVYSALQKHQEMPQDWWKSLLLAKLIFMAGFRHSTAWTEQLEATQNTVCPSWGY